MKKYLSEINIVKAFGIMLVVVGHAFPDASSTSGIGNIVGKTIYDIIYSFHMATFVFASGVVSYKYYIGINQKKEAIKKRFFRLMIPYFVWGLIYIPFKVVLNRFANEPFYLDNIWTLLLGNNPYSGLWFLYTLFFIALFHIIIVDNDRKLKIIFFISLLCLVINQRIVIAEPLNWFFSYSFFYYFGMIFKKYYKYFTYFFKHKFCFIVTFTLFSFLFFLKENLKCQIFYLNTLTAISGIFMIYSISYLFKNNKLLDLYGKYSMDVYIFSGPILVALRILLFKILGIDYYVYTILAIILGCVLPFLLSNLFVRNNKHISLLLLGLK